MSAIGIRASNTEIYYAICTGSVAEPSIEVTEKLIFPKSMTEPETLSWLREEFLNVCREKNIDSVFIKGIEPNVQSLSKSLVMRMRVEGVLIEASNSEGFITAIGAYATVSSLLGVRSAKSFVTSDEFKEIHQWPSLNEKFREAGVVGVAGLGLR